MEFITLHELKDQVQGLFQNLENKLDNCVVTTEIEYQHNIAIQITFYYDNKILTYRLIKSYIHLNNLDDRLVLYEKTCEQLKEYMKIKEYKQDFNNLIED